jgi:predicted DNA-binding transcriptional regulator YafY
MRSDRLLSILLLLQTHGRLSARELAKRLEVSERSIYRDVDALSVAGVPIYTERGRNGGCALLGGFRSDLTGLTADEARALFVFTGRGTLGDLGLESSLQSALRKLLASLPALHRPEAEWAQQRVVIDPRGWLRPTEDLPWLVAVQDAVWRDRRLRLVYRSSGATTSRSLVVHPYGLVAKAGIWYLIAAETDEPRLYRVSRIEVAEVLGEPAIRPENLDVEALWEELRRRVKERGTGVDVTLRVIAERVDMLLRVCAAQLLEPARREPDLDRSGWVILHLRFAGDGAARGALLGFGPDVEVLSPESVREDFANTAKSIVEMYRPVVGLDKTALVFKPEPIPDWR